MTFRLIICFLLIFCCLSLELTAQPVIVRDVISSGGSDMTGGTNRITGSVGQTITGSSSSASWIAGQGFWYQTESMPTAIDQAPMLPGKPDLLQNYPNPFNPSTMIEFTLPARASVRLVVYSCSGKLFHVLMNQELKEGRHLVRFKADDLPAGVYFYRLTSRSFQAERKMLLLK